MKNSESGARLYLNQDMAAPESCPFAGGQAVVFSARRPEPGTAPNEDAAALIPFRAGGGVLVVADGMGGMAAGEKASSTAVQAVQLAVEGAEPEASLRTAILNGFERANDHLMGLAIGAATTLAMVEVLASDVRPYHAGDSRVLVVGQRGKVKLQTVDHSPVGQAQDAGLLDESAALHHEDRHIVSNYIGSSSMRIELGATLTLAVHDTLVVGSDGLFDNLNIDEIAELVRKGPLEGVAQELAQTVRERMLSPRAGQPSKPDDLTFVLYRCGVEES